MVVYMKIKEEILEKISAVANRKNLEIGGILGSSKDGIVTDIVADLPSNTVGCRFEYYPNIKFLNAQIEEWAENGKDFLGLFHTHFSGSDNLSDADKEYIRVIMISAKDIIQYLYFPVFTLPDNELNVYKAHFEGEKIIINKDKLEIV